MASSVTPPRNPTSVSCSCSRKTRTNTWTHSQSEKISSLPIPPEESESEYSAYSLRSFRQLIMATSRHCLQRVQGWIPGYPQEAIWREAGAFESDISGVHPVQRTCTHELHEMVDPHGLCEMARPRRLVFHYFGFSISLAAISDHRSPQSSL